eukprot:gnl/TRDRNA2_/TRDRNA2_100379_c1_seq1.p2 gnl/TRDRNA2_/TRDRNA2_100379_c1~~gnl/TRDRNA2_/TRDRNA2_100379_c1_seq1.p2  ORF type:complete len:103 (+),score=8.62 gnl/TRDRNA2_/TRDRNA2_100379_c1_seq1:408-716(+)
MLVRYLVICSKSEGNRTLPATKGMSLQMMAPVKKGTLSAITVESKSNEGHDSRVIRDPVHNVHDRLKQKRFIIKTGSWAFMRRSSSHRRSVKGRLALRRRSL